MKAENYTEIKDFYLLGFSSNKTVQLFLFSLFFMIYLSTITGNTIIITVIWQNYKLHSPMYLFLGNFAFMEIGYTSVTMPKMLTDLASDSKTISVSGCITQMYFFFVLGGNENYFLAIMAYDRFLAICNPLRYSAIMSNKFCHQLVLMCWIASFSSTLIPIYFLSKLTFCGKNVIDNFFCDETPLFNFSCTDTSLLKSYFFSLLWFILLSCLVFIILSYINIILAVLKIPSNSGRRKVISTCGSHFTVVILYYSSVIAIYGRSHHEYTSVLDKCLLVFYAIITPFLNPIIYSLRNKSIREAIISFTCSYSICHTTRENTQFRN